MAAPVADAEPLLLTYTGAGTIADNGTMCGRFTLTTPAGQVAETFGVPDPPPLTPRYNVAPSQVIAVVGLKPDGTRRGIALLR